jgi:hypothetical protein
MGREKTYSNSMTDNNEIDEKAKPILAFLVLRHFSLKG